MSQTLLYIIMISCIFYLFGCKGQASEKKDKLISDKQIDESIQSFLIRPIYKKLTTAIIDTLPDSVLYQTIVDNILANMEGDQRSESELLKGLTKGQQIIYSIWIVEAEVNNGGFNQLYFNGNEEIAIIAEIGFLKVNANRFADLTKRANRQYQKIKQDLEKLNDGSMESFSKSYENNPLNALDDEFYMLYKSEKLTDLLNTYIRNHTNDFISE